MAVNYWTNTFLNPLLSHVSRVRGWSCNSSYLKDEFLGWLEDRNQARGQEILWVGYNLPSRKLITHQIIDHANL